MPHPAAAASAAVPEEQVRQMLGQAHASCLHAQQQVVWKDLAQFDHRHTRDPEGLYR